LHRRHRGGYLAAPHTRPMGLGLDLVARRKDRSEFPVEISLSPLQAEQELLVTAVIRDITDRKHVAEELEREVERRTAHLNTLRQFSEELLHAHSLDVVLQHALQHAMALDPGANRSAVYLYDPAGRRLALRASAGFDQVPPLSISPDQGIPGMAFTTRQAQITNSVAELESLLKIGKEHEPQPALHVLDLPEPPNGVDAIPLLAHDTAIGVLLLLREATAEPFTLEMRTTLEGLANLTAAVILEERSQTQAATLSREVADLEAQQRSMTERLNVAEAAMLQAARLTAVGQLAASVALEEDLPPAALESPYLHMARDQLARIAGIIERMRDFYRPARGEMAAYDLNHLLEETLALAGLNLRHGSIRMIFTPARDLPEVVCNGDQLRQVFLNLVLNAIEAMPEGGTLTVRTGARPHFAVAEVQDTGIGIPDEIRPRLFEPFFTNKAAGTGLGLSISAHIVTQHGGQIEVESVEGKGSTFRVKLPYQQRP
jgi:two-component system NtrC family sensor kinase